MRVRGGGSGEEEEDREGEGGGGQKKKGSERVPLSMHLSLFWNILTHQRCPKP